MIKDKLFRLKVVGFDKKYKAKKGEFNSIQFKVRGKEHKVRVNNTENKSKADIFSYLDIKKMAHKLGSNELILYKAQEVETDELYKLQQKMKSHTKTFISKIDNLHNELKSYKKTLHQKIIHEEINAGKYEDTDVYYLIYKWEELTKGRFIRKIHRTGKKELPKFMR